MSHYFTSNENLISETRELNYKYGFFSFTFLSDNGVFSKKGIDFGSKLLVEAYLEDNNKELRVLDVGCGYGYIGIVISKVTGSYVDMIDVNKRAVHLTKRNIKNMKVNASVFESDAYSNVEDNYDVIITNPPIRAGKNKVLEILLGAFDHLNENGKLYFVIRKDQGALSIKKIIEEKYKVDMLSRSKGYFIYRVNKIEE